MCSLECGRYGWDVQPDGTCGPIPLSEYLGWYNPNFRSEDDARAAWKLAQAIPRRISRSAQSRRFPGDPAPKRPTRIGYRSNYYREFKANNRIEEIVARVMPLTGQGNVLKGPCPLHAEQRGQAFAIWLDSQRFRCFGKCGIGGDLIDFLKAAESVGLRVQ